MSPISNCLSMNPLPPPLTLLIDSKSPVVLIVFRVQPDALPYCNTLIAVVLNKVCFTILTIVQIIFFLTEVFLEGVITDLDRKRQGRTDRK